MKLWRGVRDFFFWHRKSCLAGGFCLLFSVVLWWGIPWLFPLPEGLSGYKIPGAVILDREGKVMARLPGEGFYWGESSSLAEMPPDLIKATLAAEDKRFFSHGGMDFCAFVRAVFSNVRSGRIVSGASTISQQLIKLSSPPGARTLPAKIREFFQSRHLEMIWNKEDILSAYFERLDYGNMRVGPAAAARFYFSKSLNELSLAESALLAGIPQAPSRLNPLRHPERIQKRRDWILQRMQTEQDYPADKIERALQESPVCTVDRNREVPAPHLMSSFLHKKRQGVIKTTLDASLQKKAYDITARELSLLKAQEAGQAAVLVMDNETGDVLAWVGSGNRKDPHGGLLDGVLVPRSAGSTLKPFVYAMGFRAGSWAGEILPDVPTLYRSANGSDAPRNFNNRYRGPLSVREALACSQNIPAMKMLERSGGERAFVDFLQHWGFTSVKKGKTEYGLGLAIGNAEVRLLELVEAYAALARGGVRIPAHVEYGEAEIKEKQVLISREISFVLADILSDETARAAAFGMEGPLNLPFRCAVKTGTSSDFRDNWCIGFTREVTVGVWVGNFDFRRMKGISGISGAGPIFHEVMKSAHENRPATFPEPPEGVVSVSIDRRNGHLADNAEMIPDGYIRREWAFCARLPVSARAVDYDEKGRALLDGRYEEWYASEDNQLKDSYALGKKLWTGATPRVLAPASGATLVLDPEMPDSGRFVPLESNLPADAKWTSPTLRIFYRSGRPFAELAPGEHTLNATYSFQGEDVKAVSRIKVKTL